MENSRYVTEKSCPLCGSPNIKAEIICTDNLVSGESFSLARCSDCRFLFTNPRPEDSEPFYESDQYLSHSTKVTSFFDKLYNIARNWSIRRKYKLITKDRSTGTIIDIGTGVGSLLKYFKNKGWHVTGVEPSERARTLASTQLNQEVFTNLEEVQAKFDIITLWHVLEHLPDLNLQISHIRTLLKKDSTLYIAVPNYRSFDAQHYKENWAGYDVPRHLYHFDQSTLKFLISRHGMKLVDIIPLKLDAYYVSLLSEGYLGRKGITKYTKSLINGWLSNTYAKKSSQYSSLIYKLKLK